MKSILACLLLATPALVTPAKSQSAAFPVAEDFRAIQCCDRFAPRPCCGVGFVPPPTPTALQSIVKAISVDAMALSKAANREDPSVEEVTNKAANLVSTMIRLLPAIEREPSEASLHSDVLKRLAVNQMNLGASLIGSASLDDADDSARLDYITHMAAIASDIENDANAY